MRKKMIIFDFDGVICDSWWLTHQTSKKLYPGLTAEMHKKAFEGNIYDTEKDWKHMEREDVDYFTEYRKESHLVKFFVEMEGVILDLCVQYQLAIVSSSPSDIIRTYLEREGLLECFVSVLGMDVHKSKHEKIQMLFSRHMLDPHECLMVTDTTGDIKEARMVGVDSVAVTWGFHDLATLEGAKPSKVIKSPQELVPAIQEYFSTNL